jgi:transcriptional regulator with XRE-family HTH domain
MTAIDQAVFSIARQVFRARILRGLSQEHVAYEAEIAVQTYRRLETGAGGSSLDSLIRTLAVLEITRLDLPYADVLQEVPRSGNANELTARCRDCRFSKASMIA